MSTRIERLQAGLEQPLLITDLINILYLTGFDSSNAALLVNPTGRARLFTDFRYFDSASEIGFVDAELTKRSLLRELSVQLSGSLSFEADALPFSQYTVLASGGLQLVPVTGVVEALRAVKDADEVEKIRRAALAADRAFEALTAETWVGHSEKEIAWRMRTLLHAHGADDLSFETAIASGPNGAKPHVAPTDDTIEANTLVVADWGARLGGYCSDCTRTLATGEPPKELRRAYEVCLEAQLAAVAGIRPGQTGAEADKIARDVITAAGFGEQFGHGLGHGVGMAIHEAPRLAQESQDVLAPGQIVTIEPGIYLPALGGVRIEDLAVVTETGVELLNGFPKDLITVS